MAAVSACKCENERVMQISVQKSWLDFGPREADVFNWHLTHLLSDMPGPTLLRVRSLVPLIILTCQIFSPLLRHFLKPHGTPRGTEPG